MLLSRSPGSLAAPGGRSDRTVPVSRNLGDMVTALFVLALCSFAVMGGFLWVLTRRHRQAEQQRRRSAPEAVPPPETHGPGERLG